ncbi:MULTISPECIES: hypothetical protein [unclassified Roseateles]|uniref:hypothetical protein n=1 Tax=unclassified Roseateles TaxID=2626991 RepID=UPI0006F94375|nr:MULTISPECIES: hypothetical protein [unclassified Roseateles]KQW51371.1 hypothetical protein ASC81_01610 [Pelomonas sp. Root405]KRA77603.1 hypothetical protein ASD88_01610 [Pelomonas sp. Root662]
MQLPDSMHAASRDADAMSPSLYSRRFHAAALVVAFAALAATAGLKAVQDARPLDVQMTAAMHKAGDSLQALHGHLSRGLQVSLLAVADGRDVAPAAVALAVDADHRNQPVRVVDQAPQRQGR